MPADLAASRTVVPGGREREWLSIFMFIIFLLMIIFYFGLFYIADCGFSIADWVKKYQSPKSKIRNS
jgi:hypothetical protein